MVRWRAGESRPNSTYIRLAIPPHEAAGAVLTRWEARMLWTIFVILLVLWLLGMVTSYTLGGFIHILLVVALAVILIRVIQGRRPI
jgi:hypothetical protein